MAGRPEWKWEEKGGGGEIAGEGGGESLFLPISSPSSFVIAVAAVAVDIGSLSHSLRGTLLESLFCLAPFVVFGPLPALPPRLLLLLRLIHQASPRQWALSRHTSSPFPACEGGIRIPPPPAGGFGKMRQVSLGGREIHLSFSSSLFAFLFPPASSSFLSTKRTGGRVEMSNLSFRPPIPRRSHTPPPAHISPSSLPIRKPPFPPLHRPLSNSSLEAAPPLHSTPSSGGLSCFFRPEKGPPTPSPRHSGRRKAQTFFHQGFFFGESHGSIPPDQTSPWPLPTFFVFFSRAPAAGMGAISRPSSG